LLIILLVFASGATYVLFVVFEVIPPWVLSLIVLLSTMIAFIKHHFNPHQHSMPQIVYDSLVIATTFSLIISYLVQVFY